MIISINNLNKIDPSKIEIPQKEVFNLPERVLQFGAGVLLRALPDYFINKANQKGIFNGRIVVVKSTGGSTSEFENQDGLYTLHVRGIENGVKTEENIICSSISRVLSASSDWKTILECARKPEMGIIISNTTEVGIELVNDDIKQEPPASFPGKLLAFLYERYKAFSGSPASGMVIVPTELIVNNGTRLQEIVEELAIQNRLEPPFIDWLREHNKFCNSLVDRIVPGRPKEGTMRSLEEDSGYQDDLRIISEIYRLWAIQGNSEVAEILSFSQADGGVIIAEDIEIFRELKLRLLNGTHSLSCGLAFLAGFETVRSAMDDVSMSSYISDLMISEIVPAIPYKVLAEDSHAFAGKVLDRFKNPHIEHKWLSITLSYSAKLKMRVIPVLLQYYKLFNKVPGKIALGFAAYIKFMNIVKREGDVYYGEYMDRIYPVNDDKAILFYEKYCGKTSSQVVQEVLGDAGLWETDLTELPGFTDAVILKYNAITEQGVHAVLNKEN